MSVYNLHLLDESRDPRVIARVVRLTGLGARTVRREIARAPFLLLREQPLSRAVAARRELEQLGLSLRLERVEEPTGDTRHPLAGQDAPEEGEIVLEEGSGFREVEEDEDLAAPVPAGRKARRRLPWVLIGTTAIAVVTLLLLLFVRLPERAASGAALSRAASLLAVELPAQAARLKALLATKAAPAESLRRAADDAGRLEQLAHGAWSALPAESRRSLEELQSLRLTLALRLESEAKAAPEEVPTVGGGERALPPGEADLAELDGARAEQRLGEELARSGLPAGLRDQLRLERLLRALDRLNGDAGFAGSEDLRRRLDEAGHAAEVRLAAKALAGSIQRKGLQWVPSGEGVAGRADLPDATRIDVIDEGGGLHRASIEKGRLVFEGALEGWRPLSARLAPLEDQPAPLQRVLEAGLSLYSPQVYFATLPGSALARLRPAVVEASLRAGDALRFKEALSAEGLSAVDVDSEGRLEAELPEGRPLQGLLDAVARIYGEARHWPVEIELRRGGERWRLSGCELWLLSQSSAL